MQHTTTVNSKYTGLIVAGFIVIFAGIGIAVIIGAIRRREEVFEGIVEDKNIIENRVSNNNMQRPNGGMIYGNPNGQVTHTYRIKVKTDSGKTVNYKVSEGKYEIIQIGDRVSKPKGSTEVSIISSANAVPQANNVNYQNGTPVMSQESTIPPIPPIIPTTQQAQAQVNPAQSTIINTQTPTNPQNSTSEESTQQPPNAA